MQDGLYSGHQEGNMADTIGAGNELNTTGGLDYLVAKSQERSQISSGKYVLLSLLFPPFTLYLALLFAWRKRHLYIVMPNLTFVFSLFTLVITVLGLFPVSAPPQYADIITSIDTKPVDREINVLLYLTIIVSAIGTVYGFILWRRAKRENALSSKILWLVFILLQIEIFLVSYLIYKEFMNLFSFVSPLYKSAYEGL